MSARTRSGGIRTLHTKILMDLYSMGKGLPGDAGPPCPFSPARSAPQRTIIGPLRGAPAKASRSQAVASAIARVVRSTLPHQK